MFLTAFVSLALISVAFGNGAIGNVAFTAALNKDRKVDGGKTVVFPLVYTNHGNGYNNVNGVFTTPKNAIYVFRLHVASWANEAVQLDIYKNNEYLVSAFARQSSDVASGSNTVALNLVKNDKVTVRAGRTSYCYGRPDEITTVLTAYMIGLEV